MSITWLIFETMGTIAFAFSGAMTGLSRRMAPEKASPFSPS